MSLQELQTYKQKAVRLPVVQTEYAQLICDYIEENKRVFFHLHYLGKPFTKTVYLRMLAVFSQVMDTLANAGIEYVFVAIPCGEEKLMRFEQLFGFEPSQAVSFNNDGVFDLLIMRRKTKVT